MYLPQILTGFALLSITSAHPNPPGVLSLDVKRVVNQSAYGVELEVGTPPQKMRVNVDTGSPFLGLAGTASNWCSLAAKPCAQYGSYDNRTSSTAKWDSDDFSNQLINHGFGSYINDTVRVGGQTFNDIMFGMITNYAASFPAPSVIPGLIAPAVTFQQILIEAGHVRSHTLGVYLGPEKEDANGELLFGGFDRAKQLDKPVTFKAIPVSSPATRQSANTANFSSVAVVRRSADHGQETTTRQFNISSQSYGVLDTGNPLWALPAPVWEFVASYFHIESDDNTDVDCSFRSPPEDGTALEVGFANDKLKIRIPIERLVTQYGPNSCASPIRRCGSDGEGCAFGDAFLRSAYTFFNFNEQTITMSNVKYTSERDIIAV
ncbi:hypothetical protein NLG97_g4936 [Lecanicillium saksenae]|uniref:Uncharacterized protein n=1 Tax=Lecanicillium saksenae TaxID=468837 RepID=A0ACC1QTW0_9HYPO|nr:hypothetical protein NLG97_g4936 [Lecanicillium saksenae]